MLTWRASPRGLLCLVAVSGRIVLLVERGAVPPVMVVLGVSVVVGKGVIGEVLRRLFGAAASLRPAAEQRADIEATVTAHDAIHDLTPP